MSELTALAAKLRLLGCDLPDEPTEAQLSAALSQVQATVRDAKKMAPETPAARFEARERKDGSTEVVLAVRRGGKGQPLAVTAHAAAILVQVIDQLRDFAETGEASELPAVVEPSDED